MMSRRSTLVLVSALVVTAVPSLAWALQANEVRSAQGSVSASRPDALSSARRAAERACFSRNGVSTYLSQECEQDRNSDGSPGWWTCSVSFRCNGLR